MPYTILDHSGDLRIKAVGNDFLEALANASLGLLSQIAPPETVQEANERPIEVMGESQSEQAVAFLNELIFLAYGRQWLPKRVRTLTRCSRKDCQSLEGTLSGEPVDPARHEFRYDIKAVTYHDFKINETNGLTTIEFVCDL